MFPVVVIVNDTACINGGAAAVAIASAAGLARSGFDVIFVAAIGPIAAGLLENEVRMVLTQSRELPEHAPKRLRWRSVWNPDAAAAMAKVLDGLDNKKCIVHAHNWHSALSASALKSALTRGFKIVCTLNDYCIACPTTGFFDYRARHACSLRPFSYSCLARPCTHRIAGKTLAILRHSLQLRAGIPQRIEHFITVSEFSESLLRPYFGDSASVYRIPNPIDIERAEPAIVAQNCAYSMVSRFDPSKGAPLFAEAARRGNLQCVFVGDGPSSDEILRTNPGAEITGWLSPDGVRHQLKRSRCLVFPSLWYEAQPLVIQQAAALGIPSIVSDACAARELIEDGVTGLLFRSGNVDSLLAALQRLQDDHVATTLGCNAYKSFWANPPTLDKHVQALSTVYDRVLAL